MNWREKLWEQKWVTALLPNYMKPLDEPALLNQHTKEFVYEAEEFISDLAALSELPRMNRTFKRNVHGYAYKIKIKPKKLHIELSDTSKSPSQIKKKVFITVFRKNIKMENGFGKTVESSIYYQMNNQTHVRNIRRHPYFLSLFHHLHRLDLSLSGESLQEFDKQPESVGQSDNQEHQLSADENHKDPVGSLEDSMSHTISAYPHLDEDIQKKIKKMHMELQRCFEEFHLLDIEEKHHIRRMIQHDLPNLLLTFHSLSSEQKQIKKLELLRALDNMISFLKEQAGDLQATRLDRMNHLLRLSDIRYSNQSAHDKNEP